MENTMEMEIVFPGGERVDALMGNTVVTTNQDGTAPAPFGLFLASIGTCAGIYVLGFCRHRGLPTEGIKIVQRMHANPATRMVGEVDLDIVVPPSFPEKYHEALIRAANMCAVKKHMEVPPSFNVQTKVA
ncbi:MAG: OsmC family protein [Gemmatimonadota bacterium]|jgi:ribosomal protein S12 methylthiotransferase accessory factor